MTQRLAAFACAVALLSTSALSHAAEPPPEQDEAPWSVAMMAVGITMAATGTAALHGGVYMGLIGLGKAGHGGGDETLAAGVLLLTGTSILQAGIVLWIVGGRPTEGAATAELVLAPGGAGLRMPLPE